MTKAELNELVRIARREIVPMEHRTDLETHRTDDEDFLDIAVWELKAAMTAAFELGKASK